MEEVRQRVDIVELVREYLPNLKQAGRNLKACCPFHQEKTPSFMVNPEKQIFHCFGCQTGGDAFSFLMKMEGLSFLEAVAKLAERAGIRMRQPEESQDPKLRELRTLREALDFARDFYRGLLKSSPEAERARGYLSGRGVDAQSAERFRLGYAPRGGSALLEAAARKGYTPTLLAKAGLSAMGKSGRYRDYFWGRVLYPISNARGETVGFGARTLEDAEPKYLNSPDSVLFSKGRVLYGLHEGLSEVRRARRALLLEGYMDVIAAHQFGLRTAVAPLGTALTEEHVQVLKRYADQVAIVFDPDAAGAAAALRGAEALLEQGLSVRIATVPDGMDPDELLHRRGSGAFDACLNAAKDLVEFKTDREIGGRARLAAEEKARVASEVLKIVRKSPNEVLKREWVRFLAERLGADEESLWLELGKASAAVGPRPERRPPPALPARERDVLLCLFRMPALAVGEGLVAEGDFLDDRARRIFAAFRRALSEASQEGAAKGASWAARMTEALSPEDAALGREILCDEREIKDPAGVAAGIVGRARKERRLLEIEPVVRSGGPVDSQIREEYRRLLVELKGGIR